MIEEKDNKYILTLDEGTTSTRSLLVDKTTKIISISQKEFSQILPNSGWVEHDAIEIWNKQLYTIKKAILKSGVRLNQIIGCGITNQRETLVLWNKITGKPVYNAIVWQDSRTNEYCKNLSKDKEILEKIKEKTGLPINPYFSASKIKWILSNIKEAKELLKTNNLLFGTIETWLIWKLTNKKSHYTDISNASRTLLFNIKTLEWDEELCKIFGIPMSILPKVKKTSDFFGYISSYVLNKMFPNLLTTNIKIPITGVIGDQQSSLFGKLCLNYGDIKNTYGTGCFTLVNTTNKLIRSKHNLLTTVGWQLKNQKVNYALEGSVFIGGAAIVWLRDYLKVIKKASDCEQYIEDLKIDYPKDNQNVVVVPAFTGLGAPHWDFHAKGAIFGLERGTSKKHIVKATIESIALQTNDLINCFEKDLKTKIKTLKVDGGVSKSNYLLQFQANISQMFVEKPTITESTALGATFMAGLYLDFWTIEELKKIIKVEHMFFVTKDHQWREKKLHFWNKAVSKVKNWS